VNWPVLRRVRQVSQALFLAFAVFLLFAALADRPLFALADIFFRFDPLSGLTAMLAARAWIPRLGLGLVTVALTLLLGRVWCGWVCPMGTLLDWVRIPAADKRQARVSARWRQAKYLLLAAALACALIGSSALLVVDPLALFTRGMSVLVLPALDRAVTGLERAMYTVPLLSPLVDWLESWLRGPVLPVKPHASAENGWVFLLLAGILALNALAERFWCRYICPLGGLLGLLSRFSLFRPQIGSKCRACAKCSRACPVGAIAVGEQYQVAPSECVVCLDCLVDCPRQDIGLRPALPPRPSLAEQKVAPSPSRRALLGTAGAALAASLVAETSLSARLPDPLLVRPPGAQDEAAFLARCLRCSECIRVCPTGGLQPTGLGGGLESLFTPRLVSRLGACDYACTACGQTCPSGAIPLLELAEKREVQIGLASIDRNRCLPWSYDTACIVCEEMCPRPDKAIRLEEVTVTAADGSPFVLQRPYVVRDLCIGCGICENQCPLESQSAVRVFSRKVGI
jgi:polyferredoxin